MSTRRERDDLSDQLYQQLKEQIVIGIYRAGEPLPTIAEMSKTLGVAVRTVQTAYAKLADDGLTESNRSLGTTVRTPPRQAYCDVAELWLAKPIEDIRRLGLHGDEAKRVFEKLWDQWFAARKGERRDYDARTMEPEQDRREGRDRREKKR